MRLIRKLICLLRGHRSTQVPAVFYRSWDGFQEIGSLHCKRCGAMLGEYSRNMAEEVGAGIGSGGIRWFQSSEQVPEGWPWGANTKAACSGRTAVAVHFSEVADYPNGCPILDEEDK
jgi:hypothetical protein